ncbi:MAG: hypothetical protein RL173_831 [Fibrobacterota bacterium]|jgi:hypothetical protein
MTSRKALCAGLGLLASIAFGGQRLQPYDLGLSLWVPDGWVVERLDAATDSRYYAMYDTTLRDTTRTHSGLFQLQVMSGILASGMTARQWVKQEGLVQEIDLQTNCFSTILSSDTMLVDGVFAREIYGRGASCDSTNLLGSMEDIYTRVTAYGDIGWVVSFSGDTADVDTASSTYLNMMDSIKLDRSFASLPYVGVRSKLRAKEGRKIVSEGVGLRVDAGTDSRLRIEVMDLQGRILTGRSEPGRDGTWLWRPDRPVAGMVAVLVMNGSSRWMDRAVLRR